IRSVVRQDGSMTVYDQLGGHQLLEPGSNIRVAHVFLDLNGVVGFDVVFNNGAAYEYDATGGHVMGTNLLDLSRAYDAQGNFKLLALYASSSNSPPFGPNLRGTLIEYTPTTVTVLSTEARWGTAYVDAHGVLGRAFGVVPASPPNAGNLIVTRTD